MGAYVGSGKRQGAMGWTRMEMWGEPGREGPMAASWGLQGPLHALGLKDCHGIPQARDPGSNIPSPTFLFPGPTKQGETQ